MSAGARDYSYHLQKEGDVAVIEAQFAIGDADPDAFHAWAVEVSSINGGSHIAIRASKNVWGSEVIPKLLWRVIDTCS